MSEHLTPGDAGSAQAATAPPLTDAQVDEVARILVSVLPRPRADTGP
jgi:hypothetical protein